MPRSFPMVVAIRDPARMKFVGASGLVLMFTVYVLKSKKDGKYYIGSTNNLEKRLMRHNKGHSRYTKNRGPFEIVHKEDYNTLSEAKKREYYLKSLKSSMAVQKLIHAAIV